MSSTAPAAAPADTSSATVDALAAIARWLQQHDRADLARHATIAAARVRRPSTIVCVVGEFKQGKSSLVNALLGRTVCPVDDDLATSAITLVRHGTPPQATVFAKRDDRSVTETVPVEAVREWVSEAGNPGNAKGVERVEIATDSPVLAQGLALVDTPGMGGLGAGHAAATLGFLPFADGLVFVSDASAELSAPEIEFLQRATQLCPTVLFALTKIDLYPSWERILELDRGHLQRAGIDVPIVPVSSALRAAALDRRDRELNDLSRLPDLVRHLGDDVIVPAKRGAVQRAVDEVGDIADQVRAGLASERAILADPATAAAMVADLNAAKARLEHLRGPGAKWPQLLADRMGDLSSNVNYRFRGGIRTITKDIDDKIERLTRGDQWDEIARGLQRLVADEVTAAFVGLEQGRTAVRAEVVELIDDEHLQLGAGQAGSGGLDVDAMWKGKSVESSEKLGKRIFGTTVTTIRGAQGGIYMFGMLGTFLPTAASVLLASNPVLLGVGAVFGSVGLLDDRKRKVQARRQAARSQLRQFLDDVQFEMGNQITNLVKDIQREVRDEITERLGELQRTYADTITRAQADAGRSVAEQKQRLASVDTSIAELDQLTKALGRPAGGAR